MKGTAFPKSKTTTRSALRGLPDLSRVPPPFFSESDFFGRLRRELIWTLGEERSSGIFARLGYSRGALSGFDESVSDLKKTSSSANSNFFVFEHAASFEAKEHLKFFSASKPQCWFMAGYLTGAISAEHGRPIYFLETACVAKNDKVCRFEGRPRRDWPQEDEARLWVYEEDNMALELKETVEQLQLTRDRFQTLFEQASIPIFIVDPTTGAHRNVNVAAEDLTGYGRESLLKMTIFDLLHTQEHRAAMADLKNLSAHGRPLEREASIVRKDGLVRVIAESCKVMTYGNEKVIQIIMRDISDLKLSEQKEKDLQHQLLRSERLSSIGRLAASVAHELKNPLGAIRNAIYYVRDALTNNPAIETDPHLKEVLTLAEEEVDSSVRIIGELLDFSSVVELYRRRTQINELLEKLPHIITIPDKVKLSMNLDLTIPSAMVDRDRLNQVFANLASNAIQAMPKGGTLGIRSHLEIENRPGEPRRDWVVVTFEDTGSGIRPEHLAKIFEPLFTTKAQGTGLGLAITHNIIEKHGGVILVTSQVGKGTAFTIKLPLNPSNDETGENT